MTITGLFLNRHLGFVLYVYIFLKKSSYYTGSLLLDALLSVSSKIQYLSSRQWGTWDAGISTNFRLLAVYYLLGRNVRGSISFLYFFHASCTESSFDF